MSAECGPQPPALPHRNGAEQKHVFLVGGGLEW